MSKRKQKELNDLIEGCYWHNQYHLEPSKAPTPYTIPNNTFTLKEFNKAYIVLSNKHLKTITKLDKLSTKARIALHS